MPLEENEQVHIAAIREHWLGHRCMPFPADGLVPREYTRPLPGTELSSGAQAVAAADFAAALIAGEVQRLEAAKNPKSPFTTLLAHAATAFATRHEALLSPVSIKSRYHPGVTVCGALRQLSLLRDGPSTAIDLARQHWRSVDGVFVPKLLAQAGERKVSGPRNQDGVRKTYDYADDPTQLPYAWRPEAPLDYRCTCQDCSDPAAPTQRPAVPDRPKPRSKSHLQTLRELRELLVHPGAEWWLLSRLFLAALHGHLGWMPARTASAGQVVLDRRIEKLLRRRRDQPQADHDTGLAVGLVEGLRWQAPTGQHWHHATLTDLAPQDPAAMGPAVMKFLSKQALDTDFFQTQWPLVMALAREIASDLTSPALAPASGARAATDWQALQMHMDNTRRTVIYHLAYREGGPSAVPAGKGRHPPCTVINADFIRDKLLPRLSTIASYHGWMHERGHDIVAAMPDSLTATRP
ncbi:hypothetical protein KAK07_02625 [Ideonella sp. 4Y16]|uniref:hypothetical protein n=1 Tax=Ideonella alba TaxID=2824118 RepID=UPI001B38A920|nr:hypothetical protein [Ideonella alba]MBQ0942224.1 hypothetical protein [Ideonella alba]